MLTTLGEREELKEIKQTKICLWPIESVFKENLYYSWAFYPLPPPHLQIIKFYVHSQGVVVGLIESLLWGKFTVYVNIQTFINRQTKINIINKLKTKHNTIPQGSDLTQSK